MTVDTGTPGSYQVTYNAFDAAGNPAVEVIRTVNVSDNTAPVITLLGANPLQLTVGDVYSDPGATAVDNVDGVITASIDVGGDTVTTASPGSFTVTYDVSDAAGNPAVQVTRTVIVSDLGSPVITLLGANPLQLTVGDVYSDPGATALDDVDGDITASIDVGGDTVSTASPGSFTVTYDVSDAAGNPAVQVTRTVIVSAAPDTTPPVITLLGANPLELTVGGTYVESGCDGTSTTSTVSRSAVTLIDSTRSTRAHVVRIR